MKHFENTAESLPNPITFASSSNGSWIFHSTLYIQEEGGYSQYFLMSYARTSSSSSGIRLCRSICTFHPKQNIVLQILWVLQHHWKVSWWGAWNSTPKSQQCSESGLAEWICNCKQRKAWWVLRIDAAEEVKWMSAVRPWNHSLSSIKHLRGIYIANELEIHIDNKHSICC